MCHWYVNSARLLWQCDSVMVNRFECCMRRSSLPFSVFTANQKNPNWRFTKSDHMRTVMLGIITSALNSSSNECIISRPLQTWTYSVAPALLHRPLVWVNHRLTMLSPLMEPSPPLWGENWRGAASALFTLDLHFLGFWHRQRIWGIQQVVAPSQPGLCEKRAKA